jgi:hypothetical protein
VTNSVTVNGITYNDGDTAPNNMGNGGHRTYLLPMLADSVADLAAKAAAAAASATAAGAAANAVAWVSGTTYALNAAVISPINQQTYRRAIAGAGTTDPSLDATNWVKLTAALSGSVSGAINENQGADIASAATINLTTATGNLVDVTGSVTITAITLAQGARRVVRFTSALTLTHGASLALPGAANITTAAGDTAEFWGYAGGVVRCVGYNKASGTAVISSGITTINAAITTSTTITASNSYVPVAMSSLGQSVTLPSAVALSAGGLVIVIDNTLGTYPAGIRDNTGTLITAVKAGGEVVLSLKTAGTQAGVWSYTGDTEPGLITVDSTFSSTYASTVLAPFVALDANISIHFAKIASGFAAFVVDNLGKVISTPVTVDTGSAGTPSQCYKISSTSAILFYTTNAGAKAVVLTVSGASPTLSMAVGTAQLATVTTNWGGENSIGVPTIAQLSSTLYLASYQDAGTTIGFIAISVSGATVTIGTPASIAGTFPNANITTTYPLTATTALVHYKDGGAAPYNNNAVVISVSGTTCTAGTPATITGNTSSATTPPCSVLISATKAIVCDDNNIGNTAYASALTISGATVTAGTAVTAMTASGTVVGASSYVSNSATRYNPHMWTLTTGSTNTVGIWMLDNSSFSKVGVFSETAGVITAGTTFIRSISSAATNVAGYGVISPQSSTDFISLKQQVANTAGFGLAISANKIAGSTITQGQGHAVRNVAQVNPASPLITRMTSGDYFIQPFGTSAIPASVVIPVFRSNGDSINYRGEISCPPIACSASANVAISGNRAVLLGATFDGTTVSTVTYQLRLLNVEIAA